MIQPYEIIFYDDKFIKPPKRGKTYSKDEFNQYYGMIAGYRENTSRNYLDLKKLAKDLEKSLNEKVKETGRINFQLYDQFFGYQGRASSYAKFGSRDLKTKDTWTYESMVNLFRNNVKELTEEINKIVQVDQDKVVFSTPNLEEFLARFQKLKIESILYTNWNWEFYIEERFFGKRLPGSFYILEEYPGLYFHKKREVMSSKDLIRELMRGRISTVEFDDIIKRHLEYSIQKELSDFRSDRNALKKYVAILYEKFEVRGWKMTYGNISRALDHRYDGYRKMIFLKGVRTGISFEGERIDRLLDLYRFNLSINEEMIIESVTKSMGSSSWYGFLKPKLIAEKTLSELHNYKPKEQTSISGAQAQRIRILRLKYKYQK